jgi:hypothetical protein
MKFDFVIFKAVTYQEMYDSYVKRLEFIREIANPHHRKIAQNYYLHSLLEVAGRYVEIFDPRLTVDHPIYIFHHTGKVFDGRTAVQGFYRAMAESEENVIYSDDHHFAVADWGFTLEQVSHFYLTPKEFAARTGFDVEENDDVYVEHRPTMRAWPYDEQARMIGETLYYGHYATYSRLSAEEAITPLGVKNTLAPLIDDAWSAFLESAQKAETKLAS